MLPTSPDPSLYGKLDTFSTMTLEIGEKWAWWSFSNLEKYICSDFISQKNRQIWFGIYCSIANQDKPNDTEWIQFTIGKTIFRISTTKQFENINGCHPSLRGKLPSTQCSSDDVHFPMKWLNHVDLLWPKGTICILRRWYLTRSLIFLDKRDNIDQSPKKPVRNIDTSNKCLNIMTIKKILKNGYVIISGYQKKKSPLLVQYG